MLCPCSFNESKLYTLNPKCEPWAYIRGGLVFGRIFGLVYRGLIFGGLIFGILRYFGKSNLAAVFFWSVFLRKPLYGDHQHTQLCSLGYLCFSNKGFIVCSALWSLKVSSKTRECVVKYNASTHLCNDWILLGLYEFPCISRHFTS